MRRKLRGALAAAALFLLATPAFAQQEAQPPPPPAQAAEVQPSAPPPSPTPTPTPKWAASLGAGLSITSGNTDTKSFSFSFNGKYTPNLKTLFKAEALYLYGKADEVKNVDKSFALARGEYTLTKEFFAFGEISYQRDVFKNVDYLVSPLVGVGYRFIKTETMLLAADTSIGAAFERDTGQDAHSSGAFGVGEQFQWKISPTTVFNERVSGLWKTNDLEDFNVHFEAGIAASITKKSELKATYLLDFKNQPTGEGIEKTDSTIVLALVLKL